MTTFNKKTETTGSETKTNEQTGTKTEEQKQPRESRIKADEKLWNEATILADMLSFCRPHFSRTESGFIRKFIIPAGVTLDKKGNAHKIIGTAPVIWSSHTDTVHIKQGPQKIVYSVDDKSGDTFFSSEGPNASCLGADDTAGVWIMLEMIKANIPGHYIFHRGEECGGLGSRWIAKNCADVLKNYQFAIAFDRKDTSSIITRQSGRMSCSKEFAELLAKEIGMDHKPDSTGMWTDTAAYTDDIAECTNISVGYYNAHCRDEKLNLDYLFKLRDAMCKIDVTKFVTTRRPGENTYQYSGNYNYGGHHGHRSWDGYNDGYGYGYENDHYEDYYKPDESKRPKDGFSGRELDKRYNSAADWLKWYEFDSASAFWVPKKGVTPPNPEKFKKKNKGPWGQQKSWLQQQSERWRPKSNQGSRHILTINEHRDLKVLIRDNPGIIADLLEDNCYELKEVKEYVTDHGGVVN